MAADEMITGDDQPAERDRWLVPLIVFGSMATGAALFATGMLVGSRLPPLCPAPPAITLPTR